MKICEAIILAGGLGTRLRTTVPDLPKCMAPVNGRPFIAYVIDYLMAQGIEKFILSLGYMHENVIEFIEENYKGPSMSHQYYSFQYSVEDEPLGTGGAIKLACKNASEPNVIATNGDTLFKINIQQLAAFHTKQNAACTLALKPMQNFDRYGVVELNNDLSIQSFKEKQQYAEGLINGGVYTLNTTQFLNEQMPEKFSFEKDYLEALYKQRKMYGLAQDAYFIDIGIPEDYARVQEELK